MPVVLWVFNILIMTSISVEDTGLKENEEFLEILLFIIIIIIIIIIILLSLTPLYSTAFRTHTCPQIP